MVDIQIGDKVYKDIPENFDELLLGKFIDITKFFEDNKDLQKDKQTEYSVKFLSKILSAPIKEIYNLNTLDFTDLMEFFSWLGKTPKSSSNKKTVKIGKKEFIFKDYNSITAGEQISIETLNNQAENKWDVVSTIYAILCRPVVKDARKKVIAPLEDDWSEVEKRAKFFEDNMIIGEVYSNLINFTNGAAKSSTKTSQGSSGLKIIKKKASS